MNFSLKNFGVQNTPASMQAIGNILLLLAAIGVAILSLPATVPGIIIPATIMNIANWFIGLGVIGKVITKFFGDGTAAGGN